MPGASESAGHILSKNIFIITYRNSMAKINRDFFITQFREEVNDHVHRIAQRLFQLEEQPADQLQIVEEIFRIAHTLKGSSRMMGYTDISTLAHRMEDLLVEVRDEHLELNATVIDLLFYSLDTINYLIEGISKNVKRTANLEEISALFTDVIAGKQIEVPHLQSRLIQPARQEESPQEVGLPLERLPARPEPEAAESRQYVRIHTADLDSILNLVGEVLINQYRYEGQRTAYQENITDLRAHRQKISELQKRLTHGNRARQPRLAQLADDLEHSATDMLRKTKAMMKKARTDGQQMRVTMNKLQEQVIGIRMVAASRIFHAFPRLVRMTARKLGKEVELHISGEDTKIDSRIIEEMRDPLIHLVQNAIRHGIEDPESRKSYRKNPTGSVTISAAQEGNRIVIRVKDDGRGIRIEQIKEYALKEGFLSHRDLKAVSDQDVHELLFHPGFSTIEAVDDIAGRGFGLNIVRTHVDRVQGEIEVRAEPGEGTEFAVKLPLTLTIINALLMRVRDQLFAIPTGAVEKTFDIHADDIKHFGKLPVVAVDEDLIPVVQLEHILRPHPESGDNDSQAQNFFENTSRKTVIMIHAEDRRIGFVVDDLIEEREIVIKHLGPCLKRVRNVAGATTVQGEIAIILYVRDLVRSTDAYLESQPIQAELSQGSRAAGKRPEKFGNIVPKILLVDDSYNTCEVERTILEDAGYEVDIAENGVRGLEKLQQNSFDLVITDIEMPEMDGFQLLQHIRDDPTLREIPVIIMSTREMPEDKDKGLALGAQAYIVKGAFDEHPFLETIDFCLK